MASQKFEDALRKVTALNGVKAALVFDQYHTIIGRDVPGQYSNDILKRIAAQLSHLALLSAKKGAVIQEFRLVYDKYAVYTRLFAKNFYLVVFMDRDLEPADFRQPLNLSVLVLDRRTMSNVAEMAESSLKDAYETDTSFAGQFRKLCVSYLGQTGRDIIDLGLEELYLFPPVRTEVDMRKLRTFALEHVVHPLKKRILELESEELIQKILSLA
jgi:hypothetical protein